MLPLLKVDFQNMLLTGHLYFFFFSFAEVLNFLMKFSSNY